MQSIITMGARRSLFPTTLAACAATAVILAGAEPAFADSSESSADPEFESESKKPPKARRGFQMALRTGVALPYGAATGAPGDDLSKTFGYQIPIFFEIGTKLHPNVNLGGYAGLGFGGEGSSLEDQCRYVSCMTVGFQIGVAVQAHFLPAARWNPWIGYGFGFETLSFSASGPGGSASVTASGFEFGRFSLGVDGRFSKSVGVGPFVDATVAQFSSLAYAANGSSTNGDIARTDLHSWVTFGLRMSIYP